MRRICDCLFRTRFTVATRPTLVFLILIRGMTLRKLQDNAGYGRYLGESLHQRLGCISCDARAWIGTWTAEGATSSAKERGRALDPG